jgi:lysophospholipase L1-like esterase
MKASFRLLLALAMLGGALVGAAGTAKAHASTTYYLALGDSVAAGCSNAFPDVNRFVPNSCGGRGYDDQLAEMVHAEFPSLHVVNLACGGETAGSMISVVRAECFYPHPPQGTQLDVAVAFLEAHPGQIAFITITIGANDALPPCFDPGTGVIEAVCIQAQMPQIQSNLAYILETLQAAAPGVPIAGMSYYDPFLGYWVLLPEPDGQTVAQSDEEAIEAMNAGLVSTYQAEGALVADVAGPEFFNTADFTDRVVTKDFGDVPVNVANACAWTRFCGDTAYGPGDVHPNTEGHGVIAAAFAAVLPA